MISDIRLQHFRSYEDATFEFGSGVNIVVGPNGSGKTNLLEALLVTARGSSYRVADAELVRHGAEWLRLDAHTTDESLRTVKILVNPASEKTFEIGGHNYKRLPERQQLPVVLFEPNHLQLLHGSPEQRRSYLDEILEQTSPGFKGFRRNYKRVLAQRNSLLKRAKAPSEHELFPWDLRLSELGAVIARERAELVGAVNEQLDGLYGELSKDKSKKVVVQYQPYFPVDNYSSALLQALSAHRTLDVARGFTGRGPHREDFAMFFGDNPVSLVASRGETRTLILALKVFELEYLQGKTGSTPLLLLDDVFSELDGSRRQALTTHLNKYQTFLTTTDADVVVHHFMDKATILPLG
ncbi:MAG: DNA replication and repair protein RecF [Candidatus Saccharimonadales bacterium]